MKQSKSWLTVFLMTLFILSLTGVASAQRILYVPFDDRPVSCEYPADTLKAAGMDVVMPPLSLLASRGRNADPQQLWRWIWQEAPAADALVVSQDAVIYGGLVASRTHQWSDVQLSERLGNYQKLIERYPALRIYLFSTIMRSPHASSGGVEPPYYEQYGPDIFALHALTDKAESEKLTAEEQNWLNSLRQSVPQEIQRDWVERREKNYRINLQSTALLRQGVFSYMILGRDDCSPHSRSHQEARWMKKETADLKLNKYATFPGADQLGLLMLTRAVNDMTFTIPSVRAFYAEGVGEQTVPSYEDTPVGENVRNHLWATGCLPLQYAGRGDLTLAVNTPYDGWTREAGRTDNVKVASQSVTRFAERVADGVRRGDKISIADISFANGSDNALMEELAKKNTLTGLEAYSGWNTASNTIGYAIGQGVLASHMLPEAKHRLLTVRLLDDWAYQANVRQELLAKVLEPAGHSNVQLDELRALLAKRATTELASFAAAHMPQWKLEPFAADFPWNRMFETHIEIKKP